MTKSTKKWKTGKSFQTKKAQTSSKGEQKIEQILRAAGIRFEREKHFDDLRGGKFRFDFYIITPTGRQIVIEFNGRQHYEYSAFFFHTQGEWLQSLERDRRKISYCISNGIDIYEIPFWDLDQIENLGDLLKPKYVAHSRWHNDLVRKIYDKNKK